MSNLTGPYYQFNSGDTLMADHLNQMQQNIMNNTIVNVPEIIEYDYTTNPPITDTFTVEALNMTFYKISDKTFTIDQINNKTTMYASYKGEKNLFHTFQLTEQSLQLSHEKGFTYGAFPGNDGSYAIMFCNTEVENEEIIIEDFIGTSLSITVPSPGIYIPYDGVTEGPTDSYPWYIKLTVYTDTNIYPASKLGIQLNDILSDSTDGLQTFSGEIINLTPNKQSIEEILLQQEGYITLFRPRDYDANSLVWSEIIVPINFIKINAIYQQIAMVFLGEQEQIFIITLKNMNEAEVIIIIGP